MASKFASLPLLGFIILVFGIREGLCGNSNYGTTITLHHSENYNKSQLTLNLDTTDYFDFKKLGVVNPIKALTIDTGSCVEFHVNTPPAANDKSKLGNTWTFVTKDRQPMPTLPGKISFVRSCVIQTTQRVCPPSFFMMSMAWNAKKQLTDGLEIGCQRPQDTIIGVKQWTHVLAAFSDKKECGPKRFGFAGFYASVDMKLQKTFAIEPKCRDEGIPYKNEVSKTGWTITEDCEEGQILAGVEVDLETNSNLIKAISAVCQAPNIAHDCTPADNLEKIANCKSPSSVSQGNLTCKIEQAVGTGKTKSQTKENSRQIEFYAKFTADAGIDKEKLSANVGASLGLSAKTGYSWGNATEDTFTNETTYTIETATYSGWQTDIYQVAATCGFLEMRPNYFKRVDSPKH